MSKIKSILVSQPVPADLEKSPYGELIRKHGVNIEFIKFFKIEGVSVREFRDEKVYINEYTAIIFNSKHAVDHFFSIAKDVRIEIPETMKYVGVSGFLSAEICSVSQTQNFLFGEWYVAVDRPY